MDIRTILLEEHSKNQCDKVRHYIGENRVRFKELMKVFLSGDYRLTQRAAWPLSYICQDHPFLMKPYFAQFIQLLKDDSLHVAVRRNITRIFRDIEIPAKFHGELMDLSFRFISSNESPAAVKAFSLAILEKLSNRYPEIIPEIKLLIEERWPLETAAFRSRAKHFLRSIEKN